jgi:hypothetical protein
MKKITLLSGIIIATLVSCSTDDFSTYEQNQNKTILNKENPSDFFSRKKDTIFRDNDSTASEPVKPIKD